MKIKSGGRYVKRASFSFPWGLAIFWTTKRSEAKEFDMRFPFSKQVRKSVRASA